MLEAIKNRLVDYITQFICETVEANIGDIVEDFVDGFMRRLSLENMLVPQADETRTIYQEPEIMYDPDEACIQAA